MRVKVWGARARFPPGSSTNRYGGNTSCPRSRSRTGGSSCSTPARVSATSGSGSPVVHAGSTSCSLICTRPHPGLLFAPRSCPRPKRHLGAARRRGSPSASPTSPRRSHRFTYTSPGQNLLPRLPGGRLGDRPRTHPSSPVVTRSHPRLPDQRGRHVALLHPRPGTRPQSSAERSRTAVAARLRSGARRLAPRPRLPVHRRRVPEPRRLGPLLPRRRARLRSAHRGTAAPPLPPRSAP